ncbi:MAG: NADH-quinone oxidoreductase subunit NuoG [Nitrospirae bacterium]|nr:NADH-quinone oxidoreductase subunit NuoG [Nitrospirota bacterium]
MITVTINGKQIKLEKPVSILEAAKMTGIKIPTLCHHKSLEAYGGCRLCLVEIEKMPRLQASCTQYVTDGMVVWTETGRVVEARKAMLEFLLINHALDCPYCDKAGECDLQDLVMKYGPAAGRFTEGKRKHPESYDDPIIVRNMERCISCTRCVRMCSKVQGASAISMVNRTSKTFVEPFSGGRYNCEYCGNCINVCPVGAIMSRLHKHTYRPWFIEKTVDTVCSFCGVGCSVTAQIRGNSIVRIIPESEKGLNRGLLCNRGRFGYDYISNSGRLKSPMIRKNGSLQETTWSEAFMYIAQKIKEIKEKNGGAAIAGVASGRCTNEDNYVFQKFMRLVVGSNNIDSIAGFAYAPARKFFEKIFGQGVTANPIQGISRSDGIFVIGGDPTAINPVLGLQIRAASQKDIPVATVGYAPGLKGFAANRLIPKPSTEAALLAALLTEMLKRKPLPAEKTPFEEIIGKIQPVSLNEAESACGIASGEISACVDSLSGMTNPALVIGRDIIQRSEGQANLLLLAALAQALNGRIYLSSELPNEQGLIDMGCLPDMLPGGRPVAVDSFRKRYGEFFNAEVPSAQGLSLMEMVEGAHSGNIKALYVMGENIAFNIPDNKFVKDALSRLELLVVQDIFTTETTRFAHVVLPAASWAEREGSYTNLEGRMQHLKKAIDSVAGLEDWKIIAEVSKVLGVDMNYRDSRDILAEIAKVSPLHKGVTYEDMDSGECMWPYKGEPLRHDLNIVGIDMPDMKALLKKPEKDKVYIGVDKVLFHSASLSRNSFALNSIYSEPHAKIGKNLAAKLSVASGDHISISTGAGAIELAAVIDSDMPDNIVLVPNNFEGRGAFRVMGWKMNAAFKAPALDGMEAVLKKLERVSAEVSE